MRETDLVGEGGLPVGKGVFTTVERKKGEDLPLIVWGKIMPYVDHMARIAKNDVKGCFELDKPYEDMVVVLDERDEDTDDDAHITRLLDEQHEEQSTESPVRTVDASDEDKACRESNAIKRRVPKDPLPVPNKKAKKLSMPQYPTGEEDESEDEDEDVPLFSLRDTKKNTKVSENTKSTKHQEQYQERDLLGMILF